MTDTPTMSMITHLTELRRRLIYCMIALGLASALAYSFATDIYAFLIRPLEGALHGEDRRMIYTGLAEAFVTYLKLSIFAGAFITMPFILYQIWRFVAPGLYKNEKRAFLPFLVATPALFFAGGAFVYYAVVPMAWRFFAGFETGGAETGLPIQLEARVGEYLSFIMSLIFSFGICFQLPVLLTLLGRAGIVSAAAVAQKRRFAIVGVLVAAAIFTPPDIVSQICLAIPLMGLYEISIWLMRLQEKKSRPSAL
ncbi:MAG: twin-arginine translocase subunit TatC [Alphaproteobacteria bacterium]|nr:twin-arginine translocase subunit TatC [Alphaproteobacteria bacterium]